MAGDTDRKVPFALKKKKKKSVLVISQAWSVCMVVSGHLKTSGHSKGASQESKPL